MRAMDSGVLRETAVSSQDTSAVFVYYFCSAIPLYSIRDCTYKPEKRLQIKDQSSPSYCNAVKVWVWIE